MNATTWAVILGAALCTYVLRASAVLVLDRRTLPSGAARSLRLVAPAVLAAVTVTALSTNHGTTHVPALRSVVGVLAAVVVVRRTGRNHHALLVGIPTVVAVALIQGALP